MDQSGSVGAENLSDYLDAASAVRGDVTLAERATAYETLLLLALADGIGAVQTAAMRTLAERGVVIVREEPQRPVTIQGRIQQTLRRG